MTETPKLPLQTPLLLPLPRPFCQEGVVSGFKTSISPEMDTCLKRRGRMSEKDLVLLEWLLTTKVVSPTHFFLLFTFIIRKNKNF